jgi:RimJ/RimL family protein N-acetyltransferase
VVGQIAATRPDLPTPRLRCVPIAASDLDAFVDAHVRRYLLDGAVLDRDWSAARIAESDELFERRGVGLWLARRRDTGDVVGFCGFLDLGEPAAGVEPQLVYALPAVHTGRGLASEMAAACVLRARAVGFTEAWATVDAVNTASVRVLERLGFVRDSTGEGAFGELWTYRLLFKYRSNHAAASPK